jgi:hypothetical protein
MPLFVGTVYLPTTVQFERIACRDAETV